MGRLEELAQQIAFADLGPSFPKVKTPDVFWTGYLDDNERGSYHRAARACLDHLIKDAGEDARIAADTAGALKTDGTAHIARRWLTAYRDADEK